MSDGGTIAGGTIAATATALSPAGIGVVRVSGDEAILIAERVFRPADGRKKIGEQAGYTMHFGYVEDDAGEVVDEVILLVMRGPHSYTAEDTVEIQSHGGMIILQRILELVLEKGARLAEPGEFTKRAFLNGRLDLSQAEAVNDLITAKSEYARRSSIRQLQGMVRRNIDGLRAGILEDMAFIEAALDDPEHISLDGFVDILAEHVDNDLEITDKLLENGEKGRWIHDGIRTVILGRPNAGKSSLLNTLLGRERAIVTDIEGTTRDVIEETIQLDGLALQILDTAGIRDTENVVERIGVERAMDYAEQADLLLYVVDASLPLDENDEKIIRMIKDRKAIVLCNKSDLEAQVDPDDLKKRLQKDVLWISAKEQMGIQELKQRIVSMFFQGEIQFEDELYLSNERQIQLLRGVRDSLLKVKDGIGMGLSEDFFTIDLTDAYEQLGRMIGESMGEDLVDEIFGKFCMGK